MGLFDTTPHRPASGGFFTPQGFVPNKPKAKPPRAPYRAPKQRRGSEPKSIFETPPSAIHSPRNPQPPTPPPKFRPPTVQPYTHISHHQRIANEVALLKRAHPDVHLPDWAWSGIAAKMYQPGPTGDTATGWNAAQVAAAARIKYANEGGATGAILRAPIHPAVDLLQALAGERHITPGGAVSDVANIASNFIPAGKAAGILGGLRGLKGLRDAADTAKSVEDIAKPTAAAAAHSRSELARLKQSYKVTAAKHEEMLARNVQSPAATAAHEKRAARLAAIQKAIGAHETLLARREAMTIEEKIQKGLPAAKIARGKQAAGYTPERAKRVAAGEQALHSTPGMAGFHAALRAHRGELPKINFSGFGDLTPENLDRAAEIIKNHPNLQHYEKLNVARALEDAVHEGKTPTPRDLMLIEHVFGKDTGGVLRNPTELRKLSTLFSEVWNLPRSIVASLDASGLFRQGLVMGVNHPAIFARHTKTYLAAMAKESNYVATLERIRADPDFPMAVAARLSLTDLEHGLGAAEEPFFGLPVAEKLTGGKKYSFVRMSGRGFTAGLDAMRFDAFKQLLRQAQSDGVNIHDERFLQSLGRFLNTITGRGMSGSETVERAMPFLNNILFSPRLLKSRLDIFFNPFYYASLDPWVRRRALIAALQTVGSGMTVLGLAALAGGKVGMDPTSADFGKIRLGNTRIDIWGGFQQPARLVAQIAAGHVTSTTTGLPLLLGPAGPGKLSRGDIALRFGTSKLAPSSSYAWDAAFGRNQIGQKFHAWPELMQRMWPLALQDAVDIYKQRHGGLDGISAALGGYLLSGVGFGVQTYRPAEPKVQTPSSSPGDLFGGDSSGSDSGNFFGSP